MSDERRLQINPQPLRVTEFSCPRCRGRMHEPDCRYYLGGWFREYIEGRRVGDWYFYRGTERWLLEQRSGKGEDFGWYLFGPDGGAPFGECLGRRLGPAKLIAQDYAEDYPGVRDWVGGGQGGEVYSERAAAHGRFG